MEHSTEELIKENLKLTKENNKLLRKMRRGAFIGGIFKLIWIAALIGVPVYLYVNFLAPVLDQVIGAAQTVQEVGGKVEGIQGQFQDLGGSGIENLLNIFNGQ